MKYSTTQGLYKASNVTFDPTKIEAYSYGWWCFVRVIGGKFIFNTYRYSNTTTRHQYKVRKVMNDLGIKIHAEIESEQGLYNMENCERCYRGKIIELEHQINKPRSQLKKNTERLAQIKSLEEKIKLVRTLIANEAKAVA